MLLITFLGFVAIAAMIAHADWHRGWYLVVLVGLLQDPVRKLTPNTPVALTFSIMIVYGALIIASHRQLHSSLYEFSRRFGAVTNRSFIVLLFIGLAVFTGLMTFGLHQWKAPMLSLFMYVAPVPAILFGYAYARSEEVLHRLLSFFAIVTSVWMAGSVMEYYRIDFPGLGLVGWAGDYIRHLPGIQIRMVSGFYRAPDIMGWHAAMLTSIGIAMAARHGLSARGWPWVPVTAWGFVNCMISGRRKAVYFVVIFAAIFVWRYFRRLQKAQLWAILIAALVMLFVVRDLASDEETRVYTRGSATTRAEVVQRLEGGLVGTIRQFGIMGAGLGAATQGVRHLLGTGADLGWQEGGLGKLAAEIGFPGVIAVAALALALLQLFLTLTRIGDVPGSSQFIRVTLFALVVANAANFLASAQTYSDPFIALTTAFLVGCLFATATLDERLAAEETRKRQVALAGEPAPA